MFWGGPSRRKVPSSGITETQTTTSNLYVTPIKDIGVESVAEVFTARDVEQSLLQITRERPVVVESPMNQKRPSLEEILADRAPSPWTLKAFNTYCARNMCLENLNFIIDTRAYDKSYSIWRRDHPDDTPDSASDVRSFQLNGMWKRILREYITPNGLQEVNLSATIRDNLLSIPENLVPPDPAVLQPAMRSIRALIEDSILLSFLNENLPQNASPLSPPEDVDDFLDHRHSSSADRQSLNKFPSKSSATLIPPPIINVPTSPPPSSKPAINLFHKRPQSNAPTSNQTNRQKNPLSSKGDSIGSIGSNLHNENSHDDNSALSMSSTSTTTHGSTTPPTTPNASHRERRPSPWSRNDVSWKKFSSRFGLKKKSSGANLKGGEHAVDEEDEGHR